MGWWERKGGGGMWRSRIQSGGHWLPYRPGVISPIWRAQFRLLSQLRLRQRCLPASTHGVQHQPYTNHHQRAEEAPGKAEKGRGDRRQCRSRSLKSSLWTSIVPSTQYHHLGESQLCPPPLELGGLFLYPGAAEQLGMNKGAGAYCTLHFQYSEYSLLQECGGWQFVDKLSELLSLVQRNLGGRGMWRTSLSWWEIMGL